MKVAVTQAPEKGKANEALLKLLAKALGVKRAQMEIIAGETSPKKSVRITGIALTALKQRLEELLGA